MRAELASAAHHDVELAEQRELGQHARGLAVGLSAIPQLLDGPDDGEEDGAAAHDVHHVQDVAPPVRGWVARGAGEEGGGPQGKVGEVRALKQAAQPHVSGSCPPAGPRQAPPPGPNAMRVLLAGSRSTHVNRQMSFPRPSSTHVNQDSVAGVYSSSTTMATLAMTWRGTTTSRIFFSLQQRGGQAAGQEGGGTQGQDVGCHRMCGATSAAGPTSPRRATGSRPGGGVNCKPP